MRQKGRRTPFGALTVAFGTLVCREFGVIPLVSTAFAMAATTQQVAASQCHGVLNVTNVTPDLRRLARVGGEAGTEPLS